MKVFVYGSLKQGYWNHYYLEKYNSEFLGKSVLFGHSLYHVSTFPGMIKSNNHFEIVHGEIYNINEETLMILDHLESEGTLYKRQLLTVFRGVIPIKAFTYLYLPEIAKTALKVQENNWQSDDKILRYTRKR